MGLIKSAVSAIGGTLHEQWEDFIVCNEIPNDSDLLMVKKTTKSGQISSKSRIEVKTGQCAIIMDSGKIVDATAEAGIYTFDASTSPSLFAGQFGDMFKEMWQRFTYGGKPAKEQAIYYINITEVKNNLFGTPSPIPYQDWSHAIPNQMLGNLTPLSVKIKCHGKYTFTISDPMAFINNVGLRDSYDKEELVDQMRSEVISSFQNVANELGNADHKAPVLEIPSYTDEIQQMMQEKEFDASIKKRGVSLVSFVVESVTLDEDSNDKINQYELGSNSYLQQGRLTDAYADGIVAAGNNEGGAMNGFMGVGMMNMASGGMFGNVTQNAFNGQNKDSQMKVDDPFVKSGAKENVSSKVCANCGNPVTGKFCTECGTKYEEPVVTEKFCSNCGTKCSGKFCTECGTKLS